MTAVGQIRPWRSAGMDDSSPIDSFRAGRMPTTEGVGQLRTFRYSRHKYPFITAENRQTGW
jgi:hypothetical protein